MSERNNENKDTASALSQSHCNDPDSSCNLEETYNLEKSGLWLPNFFLPVNSENLKSAHEMEVRTGDILMCSFPKTGTHWNAYISGMLLRGGAEHVDGQGGLLESAFLKVLKKRPSPRILNTHLPYKFIPKQAFEKKIKIILLHRNPKDAMVSFYHHLNQMKGHDEGSFEDFFNHRLKDFCRNFAEYYVEWEKAIECHSDVEVYKSIYEEMKSNPVDGVISLNNYLNTGCSQELCEKIASACCFETLKKAKDQKESDFVKQLFKDNKPQFYRKGEVGDWKNHFTPAMSDQFDAEYKKCLGESKCKL